MSERCKHVEKNGFNCGSYAFNLYKDGIDQGNLCDVHYWQAKAQRTWVGLTGDDWKQITRKANYHWEMTTSEYAERIGELTEAKLKEKNT